MPTEAPPHPPPAPPPYPPCPPSPPRPALPAHRPGVDDRPGRQTTGTTAPAVAAASAVAGAAAGDCVSGDGRRATVGDEDPERSASRCPAGARRTAAASRASPTAVSTEAVHAARAGHAEGAATRRTTRGASSRGADRDPKSLGLRSSGPRRSHRRRPNIPGLRAHLVPGCHPCHRSRPGGSPGRSAGNRLRWGRRRRPNPNLRPGPRCWPIRRIR